MKRFITLVLPVLLTTSLRAQSGNADIVVYGATPAGLMSAIAATREGMKVIVAEPGQHIGGMLTGGLSHTDYGDRTVIGGLAAEFYQKVADYYHAPIFYWQGPEPKVAEQILKDWLENKKVQVFNKNWLLQNRLYH